MRHSLRPAALGFTPSDSQRLSRALAPADPGRLFRRIQAVLLVARGFRLAQAAQITGLDPRSIYRLVHRYLLSHRVESLADQPRSGRPRQAPQVTGGRILRALRRCPLRLGYRSNVWTVGNLADYLNERYDCSLGPWPLRQRMRELDLVCKRPRYFYSEKDPHRAQKKGGHCAKIKAPADRRRHAL